MDIVWFLVLSAFIFCIGAAGVLTRRSPLVILLCLELMLNAGNLALVAFARMHGDAGRPGLRADRDDRRRLRGRDRPRDDRRDVPQPAADRRRRDVGAARMSATDLRLAGPRVPARRDARDLARLARAARPHRRLDRQRGDRARRSSPAIGALVRPARTSPPRSASLVDSAWTYAATAGFERRPGDPRRPAVGVHVPRGQRRVVPDPRLLGRLHGRRPRLRALLRLPQLLRLLDAAAGPGGELRAADRRLGVRRRRLLPADLASGTGAAPPPRPA